MELYFPIFPAGGLANSITTTVWIGILVVGFFNLRYGWVLSGLVVPGYLVPLLLVKPIAVIVILIESFITYGLIYFLSTYLARVGFWSDFFGRDRFFAILIISTLVRVIFDGYLLPEFGESINRFFDINFDYRNNLHSFGLIVVALIANQLWKPKFTRGVISLIFTVGITYLITKFILIEYTNFTLSNLSYLYEDISSSILASPKAYIILLTTAFIASRMNLRYGWDFNGILIPALLALQWYQPTKILISFLEAFIILAIGKAILKLPIFKNSSIERARKLLLFFNIGFFYKFLLSIFLLKYFPEQKISDYFAFGYLLSTLIAIKMHDKDIIVRLTRATIETSLYSIVIASLIGFSLTFIPNPFLKEEIQTQNLTTQNLDSNLTLYEVMKRDRVKLYLGFQKGFYKNPTSTELDRFEIALKVVKNSTDFQDLQRANSILNSLNYKIEIIESRYIYLSEIEPKYGWGFYLIDSKSKSISNIQTPSPIEEWGSFEVSFLLFKSLGAKTLAISGVTQNNRFNKSSNMLLNRLSIFYKFHTIFNSNTLQIRTFRDKSLRALKGIRDGVGKSVQSSLYIKGSIPLDLNFKRVSEWIEFETIWNSDIKLKNTIREQSNEAFAELFLSRADTKSLLSKYLISDFQKESKIERIDGYIREWMLKNRDNLIAKANSNLYRVPTLDELLFFDQEVVTPIVDFIDSKDRDFKEIEILNSIASLLDYKIVEYIDILRGEKFLILTTFKRYWGTYIFRFNSNSPYIVQIPRALYERDTFEYGLYLFQKLNARAILITGAHPYANLDGSSNIILPKNNSNIFNLVNQVLMREIKEGLVAIQVRGFGHREESNPEEDIILAFTDSKYHLEELNEPSRKLIKILKSDGLNVGFADGSKSKVGYEVGGLSQSLYIEDTQNKEFALMWLSPKFRESYQAIERDSLIEREFEALNIERIDELLYSYILGSKFESFKVPTHFKKLVRDYIQSLDIVLLKNILESEFDIKYLVDRNSKKGFLLIFRESKLIALVNLSIANSLEFHLKEIELNRVLEFTDSLKGWLLFR